MFVKVARPGRFELPILCLEDKSRNAISLLFLGSAYFLDYGFAWYLAVIGPKVGPNGFTCPDNKVVLTFGLMWDFHFDFPGGH